MPVFNNMLAGASGGAGDAGFAIERSLRFNSGDSSYLSKNISTKSTTFTLSFWLKRSTLSSWQYPWSQYDGSGYSGIGLADDNRISIYNGNHSYTTAVFRDVSAWYHLCLKVSSGSAILYVNNEQVGTSTGLFLGGGLSKIGNFYSGSHALNGYLADFYAIDGQALAPTDFGETDEFGVWQPKAFEGTYGPLVDQSQVWSGNVSGGTSPNGAKTNAFDGSLSTFASPAPSSPMTYTNPSASDTVISTFEIYGRKWSTATAELNDTDISSQISTTIQWHTITGFTGQNFSKLYWAATSGGYEMRIFAIRINGKLLVDSGVTVADNSFHLDFKDNSSNAALGYDAAGSNNWTVTNLSVQDYIQYSPSSVRVDSAHLAFDGSTSTYAYSQDISQYSKLANFTFSNVSTFEIYSSEAADWSVKLNGGTAQTTSATAGWRTISNPPSTVTSFEWQPSDGSGNLNAFRVNGVIIQNDSGAGNDSLRDSPSQIDSQTDTGAGGEVVGNYATWNPLVQSSSTFTNGNLQATTSGGSGYPMDMANFYTPAGTGKWYWEFELSALSGSNYTMVGMLPRDSDYQQGASNTPHLHGGISVYVGYNGDVNAASGAATAGTATATFAVGDILGWAFDAENGTLQCYKNGVSQGTQFTNIRTDIGWVFCVTDYDNSATATYVINFGQRAFAYTAPSGYKALCTANLPEPTIADGSKYFDTKLYDGTASAQSLTMDNSSLSPDFVWIKSRSEGSAHHLFDIIRGPGKRLISNGTQDDSYNASDSLTSFDSNGFSLGADSTTGCVNNPSEATYSAWTWDAGTATNPVGDTWQGSATKYIGVKFASASGGTVSYGQSSGSTTVEIWTSSNNSSWTQQGGTQTLSTGHTLTTSDQYVFIRNTSDATFTNWYAAATNGADGHYSSQTYPSGASWSGPSYSDYDWRADGGTPNNDGSIFSIIRANPSAGFSICTYTGTEGGAFGHGLNSAPKFVWVKRLNASADWCLWHTSISNTQYLMLNQTAGVNTFNVWGNTSPTSSVVSVSGDNYTGNDGDTYVAYCFAPVEGYSAMGSYTGGGSTDGTFVYTGFRPRFLLIKANAANEHWIIIDSARDTYNLSDAKLSPSSSALENDSTVVGPDGTNALDILSNGFKLRTGNSRTNATGTQYIYYAVAEHPFKTARAR